jgi:integrase
MMAETLKEAFDRVYQERWHGKRCAPVMQSQGQIAYRAVGVALLGGSAFARSVENVVAASVTAEHVKQATAAWYGKGSSPATINKRLSCLAAMGLPVEGNYKTVPKVLKWWLTPKDEERLLGFLRRRFSDMTLRDTLLRETTARLIWLTTRVGLRTEEALRLRFDDFTLNPNSATIHIRGTKTFGADATLALGPDVSTMVSAWQLMVGGTSGLVFPITYTELNGVWQICRTHLAEQDNPLATLKALRRSAARYLHVTKGMPILLVRDYLRHSDVETTMEYLRLTGGINDAEYRRYLK